MSVAISRSGLGTSSKGVQQASTAAGPSTSRSSSGPATGAAAREAANDIVGLGKKRKRVSRACDACFAKKDRCDGAQPICKVCRELDRQCTYDRPERKRGPAQGIRQRLESQLELLESLLGFFVDAYPHIASDALQQLRLDEGEASALLHAQHADHHSSSAAGSPAPPLHLPPGDIFPRASKTHMRDWWRQSDFAKSVAPSLGLELEAADEDDDNALPAGPTAAKKNCDSPAASGPSRPSLRQRISDAHSARARMRHSVSMAPPPPPPPLQHQAFSQHQPHSFQPPYNYSSQGQPSHGQPAHGQPSHGQPAHGQPSPTQHRSAHTGHSQASSSASGGSFTFPTGMTFGQARTSSQMESPGIERPHGAAFDLGLSSAAPSPMIGGLPTEVRPDLMGYIEGYFSSWHALYPFLDRTSVLKWCGNKELLQHSKAKTALVLAICAASRCAEPRSSSASSPSHFSDKGKRGAKRSFAAYEGAWPPRQNAVIDECTTNARHLLTEEDHALAGDEQGQDIRHVQHGNHAASEAGLETVQAWILLCLVDLVRNCRGRAWTQLGTAIRLAQYLGMDKESGKGLTQKARVRWEEYTRDGQDENASSRTWWTLFVLDVVLSSSSGRPPMIHAQSSGVALPGIEEGDEWSTCTARAPDGTSKTVKSQTLSTFVALIRLAHIVAGHSRSQDSNVRSPQDAQASEARPAQIHAWLQTLPRPLMLALASRPGSLCGEDDERRPVQPQPLHVYHLALIYNSMLVMTDRVSASPPYKAFDIWADTSSARVRQRDSDLRADSAEVTLCRILSRLSAAFGSHCLPPLAPLAAMCATRGLETHSGLSSAQTQLSALSDWLDSVAGLHRSSLRAVRHSLRENARFWSVSAAASPSGGPLVPHDHDLHHIHGMEMGNGTNFPGATLHGEHHDPFVAQWSQGALTDLSEGSLALYYALGGPSASAPMDDTSPMAGLDMAVAATPKSDMVPLAPPRASSSAHSPPLSRQDAGNAHSHHRTGSMADSMPRPPRHGMMASYDAESPALNHDIDWLGAFYDERSGPHASSSKMLPHEAMHSQSPSDVTTPVFAQTPHSGMPPLPFPGAAMVSEPTHGRAQAEYAPVRTASSSGGGTGHQVSGEHSKAPQRARSGAATSGGRPAHQKPPSGGLRGSQGGDSGGGQLVGSAGHDHHKNGGTFPHAGSHHSYGDHMLVGLGAPLAPTPSQQAQAILQQLGLQNTAAATAAAAAIGLPMDAAAAAMAGSMAVGHASANGLHASSSSAGTAPPVLNAPAHDPRAAPHMHHHHLHDHQQQQLHQ